MSIIISGKTKCILCDQILMETDELEAFPAFLPREHNLGKFSDAAMHKACFLACPECERVDNLYAAYRLIIHDRPTKGSLEEIEAWNKKAFQDWPPKGDVVVFEAMFPEDGGDCGFWMDADDYKAMCEAEEKEAREQKELREYYDRLDREAWQFVRDDE